MRGLICILFCLLLLFSCTRPGPASRTAGSAASGSALVSVQLSRTDDSLPCPALQNLTVQIKTDQDSRRTFLDLNRGNAVTLFKLLPAGNAELRIALPGDNTLLETVGAANFMIQEDMTIPLMISVEQQADIITARLQNLGRLVLWCTFEDASSVTHPEFGSAGMITGGGFAPGKFGNCYTALYNENLQVSFPGAVITANRGCIEFWARLEGYDPVQELPIAVWPGFFTCKGNGIDYAFGFAGNDGIGGGGLCFHADNGGCATGSFQDTFTLELILGAGRVDTWHHYAVSWDIDGIPGEQGRAMIFLDGRLHNAPLILGSDKNPTLLRTPENLSLQLIRNDEYNGVTYTSERVFMDNLKIWNYAKTDFRNREQEGL